MRAVSLATASLAFVTVTSLGACDSPQQETDRFSGADIWPYFLPELVDARAPYEDPRSRVEVDRSLTWALVAPDPGPLGLSAADLRNGVLEALNIGFLVDGLDERDLDIVVLDRREERGARRSILSLSDTFTFELEVEVLEPLEPLAASGVARPGILALHGHGDDAGTMFDRYLGAELVAAGFVVVAPQFRHMACGPTERDQSLLLLRDGFSLIGFRVGESLLALRLLRSLEGVAPDRVAVLGHSGGSSAANLLVRLTDDLAAVVTDHAVDYRNVCGGHLHCETVPRIFPLAADINDASTLVIPNLRVPYGYATAEDRDTVLAFLTTELASL